MPAFVIVPHMSQQFVCGGSLPPGELELELEEDDELLGRGELLLEDEGGGGGGAPLLLEEELMGKRRHGGPLRK